ncbi:hypothetical protein [Streptomyces sp. NPDC003635]
MARVHRTTTTATLLVTVAVSALSGCVTVQRPPASAPVSAPSQPPAPRPDGRTEPQVVQAPALEALERIGPPRREEPRKPPPRRPTPAAPAPAAQPERPPAPRAHPRPARPEQPRPGHSVPQRPRVEVPDVTGQVRKNTDICALGRRYGGWRADSPEARICEQTYGR